MSEIHLKFGTLDFHFITYMNLPFYFFHEYLSHIHSANLFNECYSEQTSAFEDGWLIYVAHQEFIQHVKSSSYGVKILHHREHFINKYIYSITYGEKVNRYARTGYELAKKFDELIGKALFNKISYLLASTDYSAIQEYSPLHTNFLHIVKKWLGQNLTLQPDESISEKIELLSLAVDDDNPVKSILDVMQ